MMRESLDKILINPDNFLNFFGDLICQEKALEQNENCILDEYGCPEDLTCTTKCSCSGGFSSTGLICSPPIVGCIDSFALNYSTEATCSAPVGHYIECWYHHCEEEGCSTSNTMITSLIGAQYNIIFITILSISVFMLFKKEER